MRNILVTVAMCAMAVMAQTQTYQLVWSDEFNGNSLDLSKWQYEVNCDGGGNNELQCYTNSANNVAVRNGSLVITALQQNINGKQYSSGRINTRASAAWKYGRVDFSAKTPNGIYLWPAIWMMPRDSVYGGWAASGEIDILENRGTQNTQESTLHFGGAWPNNIYQGSGPQTMSFDMTASYHVYSAIWTPSSIQFLIDGQVYSTQTLQRSFWSGLGNNPYTSNGQPFDQYFYLIINLAVGGGFFGGDANSLTTAQAQRWASNTLMVDYVRVYQLQNAVNGGVTPSPTPSSAASSSSTTSCSSMFAGLTCRTTSDTVSQVDAAGVTSSRNWLCGAYPQFCTAISSGGQYASCNSVQQLSYAMDLYYKQFSSQGSGACYFGGIGKIVTQAAATVATPSTAPAPCARASYCSSTMCACNGACYDQNQYCCVNNNLQQIAFCPK